MKNVRIRIDLLCLLTLAILLFSGCGSSAAASAQEAEMAEQAAEVQTLSAPAAAYAGTGEPARVAPAAEAELLASAAFSDVKSGDWFEKPVMSMQEQGVLNGYPDGTFRPGRTITAAEFVTVAVRQAGLSPATGQSGHWAADYMEAGLRAGLYDWDEIPPTGEKFDQPIRRELAVKILMNALRPGATGDYNTESRKMNDFSRLDGRYYNAVLAAYAAGIVTGDDKGNFNPKEGLTRAEACALFYRAGKPEPRPESGQGAGQDPAQPTKPVETPVPMPEQTVRGGVSQNGWLTVKGTQLCNEKGEAVVLRGMSSHGLHWFPQYTGAQSIRNTASFGANVFRVAMYTGEGGYLSQPETVKKQLISAVDAAIAADLYVIIDWHILSDGNPSSHTKEAVAFFREMTARYGNNPAVLYEICNEPNGGVTWKNDVKPYAETVVAAIREKAPKSVILIGSPTWSQDIHEAAASPLKGTNLMYTLHFYAGTHGAWLRERIDNALKAGLPVFVSEWGTSAADGNGGVFLKESKEWLDFLNKRGISWCNWSLCDKNETSAALKPGTGAGSAWTESDLSESGKFVFSRFKG